MTVTRADKVASEETSAFSASRPMKLLGGVGRLETCGGWAGAGETSSSAPALRSGTPLQGGRRLKPELIEPNPTTVVSSDRQLPLAPGGIGAHQAYRGLFRGRIEENTASHASITLSGPERP